MDYKKAEELRKEWGDKPCSHPHLEPETHLGSEFVAVKTGDYVCTICGQDFTQEERNQIVAARDSQKQMDMFHSSLKPEDVKFFYSILYQYEKEEKGNHTGYSYKDVPSEIKDKVTLVHDTNKKKQT